MKAKIALLVLALACLAAHLPALAQGAPSQIEAALLDLSARLGYSVGVGNLSNWRWEQMNFADSALGCPTAAGGGGAVLGYRFELTHNALTYDYRVSSDSALVVYCGLLDAATAAAAPEADSQYSNRLCVDGATGGPYMRSRINVGMDVEVLGGHLNMRAQPAVHTPILLRIPAGAHLGITAGPDCADGYVWWLAISNEQTGYIAESGDGGYFVQPQRPPTVPSREVLNTHLVNYLLELGRIRGNFKPVHAWSADGSYLAMPGASGSDSLWVYDLREPNPSPQFLEFDTGISSLAFRPHHAQIAFGADGGTLHLWQIAEGSPLTFSERLFLNAHIGPASSIAFSADGERLVSAGAEAQTQMAVDRQFAALVWDLPTVSQRAVLTGHTGLIKAIAYRPDVNLIFSGADDGAARAWDAGSGLSRFHVDFGAPVAALDISGDLAAVALARSSDNLLILSSASLNRLASYDLPTDGLTSLDFSPDGSMLVVGAAEGLFSIWDTASHQLLATRETDGGVYDVSFSPDGALIAVSSEKHHLALYGVPLGSG
ncbi:MAG: hypothetical protein OXG85_09650 [Chloroflexi bacterium]|nr:hypothetical protein [Chloroflexota bacterium]